VLVKFIQVNKGIVGTQTSLREVYLNPMHIISVTDDNHANQNLISEAVHLGLESNVRFSRVTIHEGNTTNSLIIIGTPHEIFKKIKQKQILRG
tara:strand:+ start:315 stop:593 length:279 start_codon:yes stop_codon:yes gene_type:complete